MRIVLFGPPGAGKGTQAEKLTAYGLPHIATGDIFRAAVTEGTSLGREAKKYMDSGELVPDEIVEGIVFERLSMPDAASGFILDGFPRSVHQAEALDGFLEERGVRLDIVLNFVVEAETILKRLTGRRTCSVCGIIYNIHSNLPPNNTCKCGGELIERDDDKEETVLKRIEVYWRETEPLISYYRSRGLLADIDGSLEPEDVFGEVEKTLKLRLKEF
ncbi:MAG: adenylate kinase [Actinomycetota bacterium]|nr:adenylate kinase [Actinomycetota bacterium]